MLEFELADNLPLLDSSPDHLQLVINVLDNNLEPTALTINVEKSVLMASGSDENHKPLECSKGSLNWKLK